MKKLDLRFSAKIVDQIERKYNVSIEQLLGNTSVQNLAYFIEKAQYDDERDRVGVHNEKSYDILDEFLKDNDKEEALFQIMESLQTAGFLSRKLDVPKMRQAVTDKTSDIQSQLDKAIEKGSVNSGKK